MIINQNQPYCSEERTSAMPVTKVLKILRGCRYVESTVSNRLIAVFADPTAFRVVSTGLVMGFIFDMETSASRISVTMA